MSNTKKIKKWLIDKNLKLVDVARLTGKKSGTGSVTHFIQGRYTSRDFYNFFINQGCPKKYFKNGRVKK